MVFMLSLQSLTSLANAADDAIYRIGWAAEGTPLQNQDKKIYAMMKHTKERESIVTTFKSSDSSSKKDCMLATSMYEFRNYLRETGILFCYSGYMTEDILVGIGKTIKQKLTMDEEDSKTAKAVFSIFVEQVQNVIRYSAEKETKDDETELRYGVLTVGREDGKVFVTCGNVIKNPDRDRLKKHLVTIQKMDKPALKKMWKEVLRGETPEGSRGAGVGFIDIARQARQGFDFDFSEVDDSVSFFTLKAYI